MNQINQVKYEASLGEIVSIKVTPVQVGVFVAASLDGHTLAPLNGATNTPTYSFAVNRPLGRTHFVMMEFSFPGAPSGAKYTVDISSNSGDDVFTFVIKKSSAVKDPIIRFKVV